MTFAPKTGKNCYLYRNTGTVASPTWSLVDEIGDVNLAGLVRSVAELKRRASDFTKALPSLIQLTTIEFRLIFGLDSTTFSALRSAFFAGTVSEWAIMSGPIATAGSQGLRIPTLVRDFPWNQPLEDVVGHDVVLASAYMEEASAEVDPAWYTVS